ncbi:hypothetical protein PoB_004837600 [Plakobranchus ocellatus]|uniref:Uncharacterized protein n=1 Tax=Plakobranchus ocellatus TaxID=259542 RepID=A0AAV4BS32_9GAST|nr:hypothetical protein PoB_004837600 [Plakobranchus ocellatus]
MFWPRLHHRLRRGEPSNRIQLVSQHSLITVTSQGQKALSRLVLASEHYHYLRSGEKDVDTGANDQPASYQWPLTDEKTAQHGAQSACWLKPRRMNRDISHYLSRIATDVCQNVARAH